ncbi:MAG: helix-turn-helix transcriptional regulator [Treponema sp.]|nr:helix-turn-helix transcriptional regulator [Treponema sp.]
MSKEYYIIVSALSNCIIGKNLLKIRKMTPELLQKRLSLNLKKARKQLSYSQEKLAEEAKISVQMMNDIEGCRRWPSEKTLTKLANALQIDVYMLFLPEESDAQVSQLQKQSIVDDLQKVFAQSVEEYLKNPAVSSDKK